MAGNSFPPRGLKMSTTFIGNTSAIHKLLQRILDCSSIMLRRKARLHWYTGEGMEEQEFIDAQKDLQDTLDLYKRSGEDDSEKINPEGTTCPGCNEGNDQK